MNLSLSSKSALWYTVAAATVLSLSLGLYNNFPFLYPDSAAYLSTGIDGSFPEDRPVFYGWFLRATHWMENVYFCMFAQGLLSAVVLWQAFRHFSAAENRLLHYLLSVAALAVGTAYSFYVCFLTPDIFTPLLVLLLAIVLFGEPSRRDLWWLLPLLGLCCLMHNMHWPLSVLCLFWFFWKERKSAAMRRRAFGVALCLAAVMVVSLSVQYVATGRAAVSRNGHIFLTSRLNELGILKEYLDKRCDAHPTVLCPYRDSLTFDFIWDEKSPFYKTGKWTESGPGYQAMLADMLTQPHFLKRIVIASLYSTALQWGSFEIEPQPDLRLRYIKEQFAVHRSDVDISMQNRRRLDFQLLNDRQHWLVWTSFALLVALLLFYANWPARHRSLVQLVLVALTANAFLCGTLSTVLVRYQGRVIFLLPLALLLVLPSLQLRTLMQGLQKNR